MKTILNGYMSLKAISYWEGQSALMEINNNKINKFNLCNKKRIAYVYTAGGGGGMQAGGLKRLFLLDLPPPPSLRNGLGSYTLPRFFN